MDCSFKIQKKNYNYCFSKILDESYRKLNKIWVDKSSKFNNISMKSLFEKNDTEMHLTHNKGKC